MKLSPLRRQVKQAHRTSASGITLVLLLAGVLAGCGGQVTLPATSGEMSIQAAEPVRHAEGLLCGDVGDCGLGDIGEGGGILFIVSGEKGNETMVEVAPKGWSGKDADPEASNWDDAVTLAAAYIGGGKSDWRLPTKDELNALYRYANRKSIGVINLAYWSSTSPSEGKACLQNFEDGAQACWDKSYPMISVRPVRFSERPPN